MKTLKQWLAEGENLLDFDTYDAICTVLEKKRDELSAVLDPRRGVPTRKNTRGVTESAVLKTAAGAVSVSPEEIMEKAGLSRPAVYAACRRLLKEGRLTRTGVWGAYRYALTAKETP